MAVADVDGGEAGTEQGQVQVIEVNRSQLPKRDPPEGWFESGSGYGPVAVDGLRSAPTSLQVIDPAAQQLLDRLVASGVTAFWRVGHQLRQRLGRLALGPFEGSADLPVLASGRISSHPDARLPHAGLALAHRSCHGKCVSAE